MKRSKLAIGILLGWGLTGMPGTAALENDLYKLTKQEDGSVRVEVRTGGSLTGQAVVFRPLFRVGFRAEDPGFGLKGLRFPFSYAVPTWKASPGRAEIPAAERGRSGVGEGFEEDVHGASLKGRTANVFSAAAFTEQTLESATVTEGGIDWRFKPGPAGELVAWLRLPAGEEEPRLRFRFTPSRDGWFTVNYAGAPGYKEAELDEIWQPLAWLERKMPGKGQLSLAFRCPIPTTFVQAGGLTMGVVAESGEFPFMPLPRRDNSRFAVGVRDADGLKKPMLFAPVLGVGESERRVGEAYEFGMRLYARPLVITEAFEDIGRRHFGFRDFRHNALGSLNDTLFRTIDYGMSEYALWNAELRGCGYSTDVPGAVKNVSSLHPLNLAMVTDDASLFDERARPIMEYLLSREKFLFDLNPEGKGQSPSRRLFGPCAPLSELVALHRIAGHEHSAFEELARSLFGKDRVLNLETVTRGDRWQDALAMFRLTGDEAHLRAAMAGADAHITETLSGTRRSYRGFFWTQFVADWIGLLELYEASGERRYLRAAHEGARRYEMFCWLSPAVPDETVTVNKGGLAPHYYYLIKRPRERAPEESVPAWRLSAIGLTPESSGTCAGHRGIFMAHHSTWFLRLAALTGDRFLHDLARHGVVGRSSNFPGYHINTARTTAYEKPDFPLKPHEEHSVNSFHYNHIFPFAVNLLDYLVTDAFQKSGGAIAFPSEFIEGYAYLRNRFHGHKPGTFYGHNDAVLWMPRDLLEDVNPELNWIAARGDGRLYLAFMNQSAEAQSLRLALNPRRVRWIGALKGRRVDLVGGTATGLDGIRVEGHGIAALVIEGVRPVLAFQDQLGGGEGWKKTLAEIQTGSGRALRLSFGRERSWVYAWFGADERNIRSVTLRYRDDRSEWRELTDEAYPFEFSVDLASGSTRWEGEVTVHKPDGSEKRESVFLER